MVGKDLFKMKVHSTLRAAWYSSLNSRSSICANEIDRGSRRVEQSWSSKRSYPRRKSRGEARTPGTGVIRAYSWCSRHNAALVRLRDGSGFGLWPAPRRSDSDAFQPCRKRSTACRAREDGRHDFPTPRSGAENRRPPPRDGDRSLQVGQHDRLHDQRRNPQNSPDGSLHPDGLTKKFIAARKASGLPFEESPPTFHEIRSLAGRLYEKERGKDFAQKLLGHSSETMTLKYLNTRGKEYVML